MQPRTITILALIYAYIVFVPWWTAPPLAGLDASWEWMLHWANAHNKQFGTEIIWPYGPLGFVFAPQYHPDTFAGLIFIRAILVTALCAGAYYIFNPAQSYKRAASYVLLIISAGYTLDALYITLLLLLLHQQYFRYYMPSWALHLLIIALSIASLVKFSVLVMCLCAFAMLSLWQLKRRHMPYSTLLYGVSLIILWMICEQKPGNIPDYLAHSLELSRYFGTMTKIGSWQQLCLFVLSAMLLGCSYLTNIKQKAVLFYALTMGGLLFLSYKAGFIRHDALRSLLPFIVLVQLYVLYACHCTKMRAKCAWSIGICFAAAGAILMFWQYSFPTHRHNNYTVQGFLHRVQHDKAAARTAFLQQQQKRLSVKHNAASDIYMHELAPLLAHDTAENLQYAPRPVPQSYSAYSAALQQINAQHISANVIYIEVYTIDNRLPALQDAPSWLQWLQHFSVERIINNAEGRQFVVLKRHQKAAPVSLQNLSTHKISVGDILRVPEAGAVWAHITTNQTWLGKTASFLYKPEMVAIELQLANGKKVTHRLIADMATGGFLLSPYVHDATSLTQWLKGESQQENHVTSLRIINESGADLTSWFYETPTVTFQKIIR